MLRKLTDDEVMEMERDAVIRRLKLFSAIDAVLLVAFFFVVLIAQIHMPRPEPVKLCAEANDRPVLQTADQVREAMVTGIATYYDNGIYTVVVGIPEEYIDYSSWCVRMP